MGFEFEVGLDRVRESEQHGGKWSRCSRCSESKSTLKGVDFLGGAKISRSGRRRNSVHTYSREYVYRKDRSHMTQDAISSRWLWS